MAPAKPQIRQLDRISFGNLADCENPELYLKLDLVPHLRSVETFKVRGIELATRTQSTKKTFSANSQIHHKKRKPALANKTRGMYIRFR